MRRSRKISQCQGYRLAKFPENSGVNLTIEMIFKNLKHVYMVLPETPQKKINLSGTCPRRVPYHPTSVFVEVEMASHLRIRQKKFASKLTN